MVSHGDTWQSIVHVALPLPSTNSTSLRFDVQNCCISIKLSKFEGKMFLHTGLVKERHLTILTWCARYGLIFNKGNIHIWFTDWFTTNSIIVLEWFLYKTTNATQMCVEDYDKSALSCRFWTTRRSGSSTKALKMFSQWTFSILDTPTSLLHTICHPQL